MGYGLNATVSIKGRDGSVRAGCQNVTPGPRALRNTVLTTSTAQTCADLPPAFVSSVTRLVTMLAIAFCWSVGDRDLGFPFLAGSFRDVERTLLAISLAPEFEREKDRPWIAVQVALF
ncbi:hypothetical protein Taro_046927 [Colocasia esculenta]|uniref:Uncharacterized protein n=1 Tax=Colocasia esculenta TaxID=4460 RepID=A0A843WUY3_COLES|nr:hypothetical protein [Colocasia esculenta]